MLTVLGTYWPYGDDFAICGSQDPNRASLSSSHEGTEPTGPNTAVSANQTMHEKIQDLPFGQRDRRECNPERNKCRATLRRTCEPAVAVSTVFTTCARST